MKIVDQVHTLLFDLYRWFIPGLIMALFDTKKLSSLEAYCRDRWDISHQHADRLIGSAKGITHLTPIGVKPTTESQTRPLTNLSPELQKEAWIKVVETAPEGRAKASSEAISKIFDTIEKIGLHICSIIDYNNPLE